MVLRHLRLRFLTVDISKLSFLYLTLWAYRQPLLLLTLLAAPEAVRWNIVMFAQRRMTRSWSYMWTDWMTKLQESELSASRTSWHVSTRSFGGLCHTLKSYTLLPVKWQLHAQRLRVYYRLLQGQSSKSDKDQFLNKCRLRCKMKIRVFHFCHLNPLIFLLQKI